MATFARTVTRQAPFAAPNQAMSQYMMRRDYYIEKPFKRPLVNHAYTFTEMRCTNWVTYSGSTMAPIDVAGIWPGVQAGCAESLIAKNKALSKLQSSYGESAMMAVNAFEIKQSYNMLVNRSLQLLGALHAVRKGNFTAFARSLGVSSAELTKARQGHGVPRARIGARQAVLDSKITKSKIQRDWRSAAKNVSATWLEYHFGWEPLVKDIYNAIDVLQNPYQPVRVVGRAKASRTTDDSGTRNRWYVDTQSTFGWRISADLSVSNPNLYRANQLGLVNPASIAWELVPFSFVVDWFLPVGAFLDSYTAFMGLSIANGMSTVFERTKLRYTYQYNMSPRIDAYYETVYCRREMGLPDYSLRFKTFKGFSVARGATAISLLIQQLKSHV